MEEAPVYASTKPQNTGEGFVEWSHLFTPDYGYKKTGAWSLGFRAKGGSKDPIIAIVREAAGLMSQAERCTDFAKPPFFASDEGETIFKFTQNAVIEQEGKPDIRTKIDVYDAKMNPWPRDIAIGKGSVVKVRYKASPWNVKQQGGVGVTLRLAAVQVITHVPYVPSHGFEEEEGIDMGMGAPVHQGAGGSDDIPLGEMGAKDNRDDGSTNYDPANPNNPYENHTGGPVVGEVPF